MFLLGQKFFTKEDSLNFLHTLLSSPSLVLLLSKWHEYCSQIGWPFVDKSQRQFICIHLKYQSFILFSLPGAHVLNWAIVKAWQSSALDFWPSWKMSEVEEVEVTTYFHLWVGFQIQGKLDFTGVYTYRVILPMYLFLKYKIERKNLLSLKICRGIWFVNQVLLLLEGIVIILIPLAKKHPSSLQVGPGDTYVSTNWLRSKGRQSFSGFMGQVCDRMESHKVKGLGSRVGVARRVNLWRPTVSH